jgi:integrase/recombinase XerC
MVENFLQYLQFEKRYSNHTLTAYGNDLKQFFIFINATFGETEYQNISHQYIRSWLVDLMNNGNSAKSINRKLSSVKSFFKFLLKEGIIKKSPLNKVVPPKIPKRLPVFVEEKSMDELLNNTPFENNYNGLRDKLIIELLYNCGLRRAELINLLIKNCNIAQLQIKVIGKGNKERIIPISKNLSLLIDEFLKSRNFLNKIVDTEYLLLSESGCKMYDSLVYRVVKTNLSLVTTIKKKSPHVLRHTFATHLTNEGADINAIKELLGHSSLAATQVYTHNSIEKLKKAFNQAHPRS